jgi:hypothetical protein
MPFCYTKAIFSRQLFKSLAGKPEGKRQLERPRRRWEDNIKMYIRELGFGGVDWIHITQDRDPWWALVNMVMNLIFP